MTDSPVIFDMTLMDELGTMYHEGAHEEWEVFLLFTRYIVPNLKIWYDVT